MRSVELGHGIVAEDAWQTRRRAVRAGRRTEQRSEVITGDTEGKPPARECSPAPPHLRVCPGWPGPPSAVLLVGSGPHHGLHGPEANTVPWGSLDKPPAPSSPAREPGTLHGARGWRAPGPSSHPCAAAEQGPVPPSYVLIFLKEKQDKGKEKTQEHKQKPYLEQLVSSESRDWGCPWHALRETFPAKGSGEAIVRAEKALPSRAPFQGRLVFGKWSWDFSLRKAGGRGTRRGLPP